MAPDRPPNQPPPQTPASRLGRILLGFLTILSLLLLTAYGLVGSYYNPERLAPLVEQALERYLPRRVDWKQVRFDPLRGFSFKELRIGEHPDFGRGAFLSCSGLNLGLSQASLFLGRIEINRIEVIAPSLTVRQDSGSRFNFSDLAEVFKRELEPDQKSGRGGPGQGIGFDLREILFRNGLARLDLGSWGLNRRVRDINIRAVRSSEPGGFDCRLGFSLGGVALTGGGSLNPAARTGRIRLWGEDIQARALAAFLPESLALDLPRGRLALDLGIGLAPSGSLDISGTAAAVQTDLVLFRPNQTFGGLSAKVEFDLVCDPQPRTCRFNRVSLDLDGNRIDLSGTAGPKGYDLRLELSGPDLTWLNRSGLVAEPRLSGSWGGSMALKQGEKDRKIELSGALKSHGAVLASRPGSLGPLDLEAEFKGAYDPRDQNLELTSARFSLPGLTAELSARIGPQKAELQAKEIQADLARLRGYLPGSSLPAVKGLVRGRVSLVGDLGEPSGWKLGGEAELVKVELASDLIQDPLSLEGPLLLKGDRLLFSKLKGRLGGSQLLMEGHLTPFGDPPGGEVELKLDTLDLARLEPLWSGERTGSGPGTRPLPFWTSDLSLTGRIRVGEATRAGGLLRDLDIKYRLGQGRLLIAPLKAKTGTQGSVSLNLTLSLQGQDPVYQGQLRISEAGMEPLTRFLDLDREQWPRGTLSLEAAFGGRGFDPQGMPENLTGQVSAQLRDGRFPGHPAGAAMGRFLGLQPFHRCEFSQWTGNFEILGGRSRVQGLIQNQECTLGYQGAVDLDGRLDLAALLNLELGSFDRAGANPQLLEAPRDSRGRFVLPLIISGKGPRTGVEIDRERLGAIRESLARARAGGGSGE